MSLKARRQSIWMDRAVGLTTLVVGTGGLVYGLNKLLRALRRFLRITFGDAYHRSRFVRADTANTTHVGSCHCECISFTVKAPRVLRALDCASKIRYPHITVPGSDFRVVKGEDKLVHCTVRNRHNDSIAATCYFCAGCGVHVYRNINISTCHVNADLIDGRTVADMTVSFYDGWPGMAAAGNTTTKIQQHWLKEADHHTTFSSPSFSTCGSRGVSPAPVVTPRSSKPRHRSLPSPSPTQQKHNSPVPVQNFLAVQFYGAYANLDRTNSAFRSTDSSSSVSLQQSTTTSMKGHSSVRDRTHTGDEYDASPEWGTLPSSNSTRRGSAKVSPNSIMHVPGTSSSITAGQPASLSGNAAAYARDQRHHASPPSLAVLRQHLSKEEH